MDSKSTRLSVSASSTIGSSSFFVSRGNSTTTSPTSSSPSSPPLGPSKPAASSSSPSPAPSPSPSPSLAPATKKPAEEEEDQSSDEADVEEEDEFSKRLSRHAASREMTVRVIVEDKDFKVRVGGSRKIEELCSLIEVEYLERFGEQERGELNCCLLLDEDAVPLEFGDLVSEVLSEGAVVYVVTAEFETTTTNSLYRGSKKAPESAYSLSSVATEGKRNVDADFKAILCNTIGLQYFKEFCVEEFCVENLLFWLDVETFRYCEADDSLVLAIAHRIFLNYISADGQLQINLNSDTKNAIHWPEMGVAKTIFDDAQIHVYSMMKGHTYRRFEQSEKNAELQSYITANPSEYASAHIDDPKIFFAKSVEAAAQENIPMIQADTWTADQRDRTLTQHMMRYWKLNVDAKGYHEDKNKLTTNQKLKRMQREKRLKKFFGEAPDVPITKDFAQIESRPRLLSKEETMELSEIFTRKKRAEKLEGFFGGKLPEQQLQEQNIKKDIPEPIPINERPPEVPLPPTVNNLTAEERRTYSKRSQKLKDILGDPISEGLASTMTGQALGQLTTGSLARRKSNFAKSRAFFETASQPEFPSEHMPELRKSLMLDDESVLFDVNSLPSPPKMSPLPPRSESLDEIEIMLKAELFKKDSEGGKKKDLRRKKLSKLQTFLGERLSQRVQMSQNLIQEPALSVEEKKLQQKKIYKLEKMFGEMPPRELIINPDDPWNVRQEKSLHALTFLLDGNNEQEIHELVMAMMEFEEDLESEDADKNKIKTLRQKKLNKLSHFFGNNVNPEVLMEEKVLADLQQAMADEIASDDELRGLSEEVEQLQLKIVRRVSRSIHNSPNAGTKGKKGESSNGGK